MLTGASCFIKTRLLYGGFPSRFQYYPAGAGAGTIEKIHDLVQEAMSDVKEIITPDRLRRSVIVCDGLLALGVSGFIADILPDKAESYAGFTDRSGTRRVFGFFGLVWDIRSAEALPAAFPHIAAFRRLIEEKILPYWSLTEYDATLERFKQGVADAYTCTADVAAAPASAPSERMFNTSASKTAVIHTTRYGAVLDEAAAYAVTQRRFSLCGGLGARYAAETAYENIVVPDTRDRSDVFESRRRRYERPAPTASHIRIRTASAANRPQRSEYMWVVFDYKVVSGKIPSRGVSDMFIDRLIELSRAEAYVKISPRTKLGKASTFSLYLLVPADTDISALSEGLREDVRKRKEKGYLKWIKSVFPVKSCTVPEIHRGSVRYLTPEAKAVDALLSQRALESAWAKGDPEELEAPEERIERLLRRTQNTDDAPEAVPPGAEDVFEWDD